MCIFHLADCVTQCPRVSGKSGKQFPSFLPRPALKMRTGVVFSLLLSLCLSDHGNSILKESGAEIAHIYPLSNEKHCEQACKDSTDAGQSTNILLKRFFLEDVMSLPLFHCCNYGFYK